MNDIINIITTISESLNVRALKILCTYYSAGIGRTGTYIALDALLEEGRTTGYVNIAKFLMKMRYSRMNMIQTPVSKKIFLSNVSYAYINVTMSASNYDGGRRDRMVVGLTTNYAIRSYHYYHCEFEPHSG
jgi:protein tyrosine phosphatase